MQSTETLIKRTEMVQMHEFFLSKIELALTEKRYIEATWLIYACMENRFFRTLQKYKKICMFCKGNSKCASNKNDLAISTKNSCIKRLVEEGVPAVANNFSIELLEEIRLWVKKRNELMHKLLSVEAYMSTDDEFESSALKGKELLDRLYAACTGFRADFYAEDYEFFFPEKAMRACPCNPTLRNRNIDK